MRLEIDGWSAGLRFSACHILPGHRRCGRLHGHTYAVNVVIEGEMGGEGYVADFFDVKGVLKKIIDKLDHRVLVPARSARVCVIPDGRRLRVRVDGKDYLLPRGDVALLDIPHVTAEELAQYILEKASGEVRRLGRVRELRIGLFEGLGQSAWAVKRL